MKKPFPVMPAIEISGVRPEDIRIPLSELEKLIRSERGVLASLERRALPRQLSINYQNQLRLFKGVVWESKLSKALKEHPGASTQFENLRKSGALRSVLVVLLRHYFDQSSNTWTHRKSGWRKRAGQADLLLRKVRALRATVGQMTAESDPAFNSLVSTVQEFSGLVEQQLAEIYVPGFRQLGSLRSRNHRDIVLDQIVTYVKEATGHHHYAAVGALLEAASLAAGRPQGAHLAEFQPDALRRKIKYARKKFPQVHRIAMAWLSQIKAGKPRSWTKTSRTRANTKSPQKS